MAGEFIPGSGGKDCSEKAGGWGNKSTQYDYIWKGDIDEDDYPDEACEPRYHGNAQIDNLQVNNDVIAAGEVSAGGITLSSRKAFDIPHPTKEGWRLRHVCLEGPEVGVYFRGRLTKSNIIDLPNYWKGLIDPETITVTLTQIKTSQDLMIDNIEWGSRIKVKSGNGTTIDCFYLVQAERKDGEKLIVEYEGMSIEDYPGDNRQYTHNK